MHDGLGVPGAADLNTPAAVPPDGQPPELRQRCALVGFGGHEDGTAADGQRIRTHVPTGCGNFEQGLARLARRHDGGVARRHRDARSQCAHRHRSDIRIRRHNVNISQRQPQLMRDDLADHRGSALPHVALATVNEHPSVFVDLHDDGGPIPVANGAVAAHVHGGRHPDATPPRAATARGLALARPIYGLGGLIEALHIAGTADVPAMHRGLAHPHGIAFVDVHRIQAQLARHGVNMAIEREQHLRATKSAEGTAGWVVGVVQRGVRRHVDVAKHVVAAHGAHVHHVTGQPGVCTTLRDDSHLLGNDHAVAVHAQLQRDPLGHADARGLKVLKAVVHQAHRPPCPQRQQTRHKLVVVFDDLGAEGATRRGLDHANTRYGQPQRHGNLHAHQVHCLR